MKQSWTLSIVRVSFREFAAVQFLGRGRVREVPAAYMDERGIEDERGDQDHDGGKK